MRKKLISILGLILLGIIFVTACSAKGQSTESAPQIARDMASTQESVANDKMDMKTEESAMVDEIGFPSATSRKNKNQKLIYRASMEVEVTKEVGPLVQSLQSFIESHDGYIENMQQYRYGYDPVTQEQLEGISIKIRIPHEHYDKTLRNISEIGVVVNKSSSVEDVTLQYSDIESTLKMYKIEQERLLEMLQNKTADVKDMIEVEKRLSEVRVEIEKQESARRALESLISYDTIELEITQVRRVSANNETKSFANRIKSTFIKSVDEVVVFIQNIILGMTYMLIPVVILLIVGIFIYIPVSKIKKKKMQEASLHSNDNIENKE